MSNNSLEDTLYTNRAKHQFFFRRNRTLEATWKSRPLQSIHIPHQIHLSPLLYVLSLHPLTSSLRPLFCGQFPTNPIKPPSLLRLHHLPITAANPTITPHRPKSRTLPLIVLRRYVLQRALNIQSRGGCGFYRRRTVWHIDLLNRRALIPLPVRRGKHREREVAIRLPAEGGALLPGESRRSRTAFRRTPIAGGSGRRNVHDAQNLSRLGRRRAVRHIDLLNGWTLVSLCVWRGEHGEGEVAVRLPAGGGALLPGESRRGRATFSRRPPVAGRRGKRRVHDAFTTRRTFPFWGRYFSVLVMSSYHVGPPPLLRK